MIGGGFGSPLFNRMKETYSSTVTETEDLGGATNACASSTWVCDRCGFAYPKTKLTIVDGLELCSKCIDKEQED